MSKHCPWNYDPHGFGSMLNGPARFDPISASTAIIALTAVSTAVGVAGAIQQSNAASKADKYNAAVAQQNAQAASDQANSQLQQQQRTAYKQLGAQKAAYGASGVTSDGSPMDVLSDSYTQSELDANTIIYNGKLRAAGYTNQANLDSANASNATTAGYTNAASKALLGGVKTYQAYDSVGTNDDGDE